MKPLNSFEKQHNLLVCIDSDGTAIDSMTSKHKLAFGPCFICEWNLESNYDEVLSLWCEINLHGKTRGTNRFLTLCMCLERLNANGFNLGDIEPLKQWATTTDKLSNDSLENAAKSNDSEVLKKALRWSRAVNARIAKMSFDEKRAFDGVKEFLQYASGFADIAIVSSADATSVKEEWNYFGLTPFVSVMTSQEQGSKKDCINALLDLGYDKDKVLMVGDAPPDYKSSTECGVHFYPILAEQEVKCWQELTNCYFKLLQNNTYAQCEQNLIQSFLKS